MCNLHFKVVHDFGLAAQQAFAAYRPVSPLAQALPLTLLALQAAVYLDAPLHALSRAFWRTATVGSPTQLSAEAAALLAEVGDGPALALCRLHPKVLATRCMLKQEGCDRQVAGDDMLGNVLAYSLHYVLSHVPVEVDQAVCEAHVRTRHGQPCLALQVLQVDTVTRACATLARMPAHCAIELCSDPISRPDPDSAAGAVYTAQCAARGCGSDVQSISLGVHDHLQRPSKWRMHEPVRNALCTVAARAGGALCRLSWHWRHHGMVDAGGAYPPFDELRGILVAAPRIQELSLQHCTAQWGEALRGLSLSSLRGLHLDAVAIGAGVGALGARLPNLEVLTLKEVTSGCGTTMVCAEGVAELVQLCSGPALRAVGLHCVSMYGGLRSLLQTLPKLHHLDLSFARAAGALEGEGAAHALAAMTQLRTVCLKTKRARSWLGPQLVAALLPPSLRSLRLDGTACSTGGAQTLAQRLPALTGFTALALKHPRADVHATSMLAASACVALLRLELSELELSAAAVAALARTLPHLTRLKHVDIASNWEVGDAGAYKMLRAVRLMPAMRSLNVTCCGLSARGKAHMRALASGSLTIEV